MKKIIINTLIISFLIPLIFADAASAEFKKTKIAVLDFQLQGEGFETADMGKIVAEWLITALVKEGRFDVIERRLLTKVIDEQKFGISGLADESSVAKLGKILGARIVITGSVMKFQNVMEVNARIIEVESTSIIAAESVKSASAVKLEDLVVKMAEKIIKDFPLEGYIVQRNENNVLIDLGKRAGVKAGTQFMVYKEGKVIKHPKTGEVLDVEKIETGTIEIRDVKDKTSDAVIIKEVSANAIKTMQLVKSAVELVPDVSYSKPEIPEKPEKPVRPEKPARPEKVYPVPQVDAKPFADKELMERLHTLDDNIEEVKQLRENGNPAWKVKFKNVFTNIRAVHGKYKTAPEVFFYYAKVYSAAGEIKDADKSLKKALHYSPKFIPALIFRGDMFYAYARGLDRDSRKEEAFERLARDAYDEALKLTQDKNMQAMLYYKIGNIYSDLADDKENARQQWQKAVSTAPGSQGAKLANERLRAN